MTDPADDTMPAGSPAEPETAEPETAESPAPEERIGPDVLHSAAHFDRITQMAKIMGGGRRGPAA